ncbi:MAG: NapC/NirT family cytochrome c [Clostridiales bacterium]|nr:NapC/NirT family cytochrome c [Clostridiales bacterium]
MPKVSLSGFKDPLRRPRYIIWTGVAVLVLAAVMIVALGATSTYWFCAEGCHKVQDDTIIAFNRSSHSNVSCMACHMKVNADPITFVLHKAEALGELYLTATNKFSLPLNPTSHLALDAKYMGSEQCTQCHNLATRPVTPSPGIIIDHDVHSEAEIHCTVCHNRVAHREDFELTLTDPNTGEPNRKHENFMLMTACFRCHTLISESPGGIVAPGACEACHTPGFELRPDSHFEEGFYPRGHADLALAELEQEAQAADGDGSAYAAEEETLGPDAPMYKRLAQLPAVAEIDYCSTCHVTDTFCGGCHGMEMPHPVEFVEKTHSESAASQPEKCMMCHTSVDPAFCDSCHHGVESGWEFETEVAWGGSQHAEAVRTNGVPGCLGVCHEPAYCQDCHTATNPLPTSHGAADWLRRPAAELGQHAVDANNEISACEVCHGEGGASAPFCKSCHVVDVPHPQEFKQFHASTGRNNPQACSNCHTYVELCSDCHHEGAVDGQPWLRVHADTTNEQGAEGCFEMCHDRAFCVECHTSRAVLPESHQAGDWTRRATIDAPARHPAAFDEQPENCSYCHGDGGAKAKFCTDCHKLEMPHQPDFKETHAPSFREEEFAKPACMNCHSQYFCDRCHHEGATGAQPWTQEHAPLVKDKGAEPCFVCHEPPTCAACHVRLGR